MKIEQASKNLEFYFIITFCAISQAIVCLTQVWQTAFFHIFCKKTFKFASKLVKPLWSTTTCMYKHTFCLNSGKY